MEEVFREVIKLYNEAEYEKVATAIILFLFILLFRCFQKIFIDNRKGHIKKDRMYKKALVRLLSCTINESNIKECYVLSEFATNEKKLNRIDYYIRTNNLNAIVKYIKEELYLLQDKEFTKYEGPESTIKMIGNTLNRIKIKDYIILPAIASFFVIYICIVFILCITNALNSILAFVIIIAIIINAISCAFSFSITLTERYNFDAKLIKTVYYFPMALFLLLYPERLVTLVLFIILTILVFAALVIILRSKSSIVNVTRTVNRGKGFTFSYINDFLNDEDVNQELINDKSLKTLAYFENYTLVALFQIENGNKIIKNKIINKAYEEKIKKSTKKHKKDFAKYALDLVANNLI